MPPRIKFSLIAIMACLTLAGCTDHTSVEKAKALEAEIEQLTHLNGQGQMASKRLETKIDAALQEIERLKSQNAKLQSEIEAKTQENENAKKAFENYKAQYKLSMVKRAPGMHVDDFTIDGANFHDVTIKDFSPTQLTVSHAAGVQKLNVELLPDSLRDLLGLNIVLQANNVGQATNSKQSQANQIAGHQRDVVNAEAHKTAILAQLDAAKKKRNTTREQLVFNGSNHKQTDALKRTLDELETTIAKLQGQLAEADIQTYQVRKDNVKMLSTH